jgi:flagellar basal body rod protein FlgC
MAEFDLLAIAADGMGVQRAMLDVAARNVAAAQASTPDHPYPRLVAQFAGAAGGDPLERAFDPDGSDGSDGGDEGTRLTGMTAGGDAADALTEMIAVLDAQRAYEANASVFDVGKRLAERTLDVGRL